MAKARTETLLPLDRYAEFMAINQDAFNQVYNPEQPYPSDCNDVWLQQGYTGGSDRIVGREDVARAISIAEKQIADFLGFYPAPTWTVMEEHTWPYPKRGIQTSYPPIRTEWGKLISGGVEAETLLVADQAIAYQDRDNDGVDDTAIITVAEADWEDASISEVVVYAPDSDVEETPWEIRNLEMEELDSGELQITGPRSYFAGVFPAGDPSEGYSLWNDTEELQLGTDANFLTQVDVYRRYNDTSTQAKLVYRGTPARTCATSLCETTCQDACIVIHRKRLGAVVTVPASYSDDSWTLSTFTGNMIPDAVRLWYYSGLPRQVDDNRIRPDLAEAIVRLANTHLPKAPCGCSLTRERYERDWEEQEMTDINVAMAASNFGTTKRGAVFAVDVCRSLKPIATGGSI